MKNCLIFGAGRSGTSALAGMMAKSGVFTGLHPKGPTPGMPTAYWEDRWVCDWNDNLITQAYPDYRGAIKTCVPVEADFSRCILPDMIKAERMLWYTPFALKDPRFAYTYPVWKPMLKSPCLCVVLFRHPSDFVDSAVRLRIDAPDIETEASKLEDLWENSYLHAFKNEDVNFCYIEYEAVVGGPAVPWLEKTLGYAIDRSLIRPELCHSTKKGLKECPDRLKLTYEALLYRATAGGTSF